MNASHAHHHDDFVTAEVLRAAVQADAPHLIMREVLGEGGMAVVFAAVHQSLNLPVAVKVLRTSGPQTAQMAERLLLEARVCAALTEAGAPRVLDARVLHDGTPYVVMERIAGNLLSDMLDTGPLDPGLALEVTDGLLATLSAVHAAGVVHRDVKPANIILEPRANGGFRVRLIDFGVAQLADAPAGPYGVGETNATQTGTVVGTPDYVAPEQLLGRTADGRADVYAAGATLFHMLTGTPPFSRPTMQLAIAATLRDPLPQLSALCPHLPLALERVLSAALTRELDGRTRSAEAMRSELRALAPGLRSSGSRAGPLPTPAAPLQRAQHARQPEPAAYAPPAQMLVPPATRVELVPQTAPLPAQPVLTAASAPQLQYAETLPAAPAQYPSSRFPASPERTGSHASQHAAQNPRPALKIDLEDGGDGDFNDMDVLFPHRRKRRLGGVLLLALVVSGAVCVLWLERNDPSRLPPEVRAGIAQARTAAHGVYARLSGKAETLSPEVASPALEAPAVAAGSADPAAPLTDPSASAPALEEPSAPLAAQPEPAAAAAQADPAPEAPEPAQVEPPQPAVAAAPAPSAAPAQALAPGQVAPQPAPALQAQAPALQAQAPASQAQAPASQAQAPAARAPQPPAKASAPARRARRSYVAPPDAPIVGEGYPLAPVIDGIDAHLQGRNPSPPARTPPPEGVSDNPY